MSRLSPLSRSIDGRAALVTGAASGMGRATAHLFADEGAKVAVTDLQQAGARIVNIASTEGWGAIRFGSPYTAAKHGVVGLTKSLAVELGREGITVNCICPGPINTGMTSAIDEADKQVFAKRRTAIGRYGIPEEVAHGTLNFCLPASRYMTGAVIPVDGGLLIRNA